jgi:hypothetical protein
METVSNLASGVVNTASRAIWGDGTAETKKEAGAEPVSGETGNVAEGEPYDKGNLDSTDTDTTKPATTESTSLPSTTDTTTPSTAPDSTSTTLPIRSEHETTKTDETSAHDPSSSLTSSDKPNSSNDTSETGTKTFNSPPPLTGRPAAEHEAGQHGIDKHLDKSKSTEEVPTNEVGSGVAGGSAFQKQGMVEVPGDKVVKSTGEYADGGNFDAANTGAGREADRLLEKKDVHNGSPIAATPSTPSSKSDSKADTPTKVSLKDKIKAKLHRHKDSKE